MSDERKKLEKQLDNIVSLYVRERDGYKCVICKKTRYMTTIQAGHLISRVCRSVRWDLQNIFAQCDGCNKSHEYYPEFFTQWYINTFGAEQYDRLVYKGHKSAKFSISDLKLMLQDFKNKLKELQ